MNVIMTVRLHMFQWSRLFKRILVPVDGSKYMEANVGYALEIARKMDSKITLIYVVTLQAPVAPELGGASYPDPKPLEEAGLKILETAKNIAKSEGADPETRLERGYGNAAEQILRIAEQEGSDLIVIGAKGHSLLKRLLVGSVCETVMHYAACPVLVIHHK